VHNYVAPFTSHCNLHEFGPEKPFSWAKPEHVNFFSIHCSVWSQVLSTVRDAVTHFTLYSNLWWMLVS
jgi:hypothetical protein